MFLPQEKRHLIKRANNKMKHINQIISSRITWNHLTISAHIPPVHIALLVNVTALQRGVLFHLHAKSSFQPHVRCKSYNHLPEWSTLMNPCTPKHYNLTLRPPTVTYKRRPGAMPLTLSWHPGIVTWRERGMNKQPDVIIRNAWLHWQPSLCHNVSWWAFKKIN